MFASPEFVALKVGAQASGGIGATYTGGTFLVGVNKTLSSGSSFELIISTSDDQIVMDSPIVNSNSGDLTFDLYEDTVFTGGTPVTAYNNDRNSPFVAVITGLVVDATISDLGTQILPTVNTVGDNNSGQARTFALGYPVIFKPNTNYTLKVAHNDGQNRQVNLYVSAFRRRI